MKKAIYFGAVLLLSSCGYEGREECENYFKTQTYEYKKTCKCLKASADLNGIKDFKSFVSVFQDEAKKEKLAEYLISSIFISEHLGEETKAQLKTLTDARNMCRLEDPEIDECIVCGNGYDKKYSEAYKGVNLMLTNEKLAMIPEIKKYMYRGDSFVECRQFIVQKGRHVWFDSFSKKNVLMEKSDQGIGKALKAVLFSLFNEELAKAYYYYRINKKYNEQDAIDQAYFNALMILTLAVSGDIERFEQYSRQRTAAYKGHDDYVMLWAKEHMNLFLQDKQAAELDDWKVYKTRIVER